MEKSVLDVPWDAKGVFISRPNRFVGVVDIAGMGREKVHVHDPGRLKELLYPRNHVLVRRAENPGRKTAWDLVAARKGEQWVLVNSGYHSVVAENIIKCKEISPWPDVVDIIREVTFGDSRLDFLLTHTDGSKTAVEVKGCTLTVDGVALFPDAPTARGKRHVEELIRLLDEGYRSALLVLVFREDSVCFAPNAETDSAFADAFKRAMEAGVEIHPLLLNYSPDTGGIFYKGGIPVCSQTTV